MVELHLPKRGKIYSATATFLAGAIWWTFEPTGPKVVTEWAPLVRDFGVVALAVLAIIFLWDWVYERRRGRFRTIGERLDKLSKEILDTLRERKVDEPLSELPGSLKESHEDWAKEARHRAQTQLMLNSRFHSSITVELVVLRDLGINPPTQVQHAMGMNYAIVAKWLGSIGKLLQLGQLKAAKELGSDTKFWWNLLH
jgi:hypothetical protein